MDKETARRVAEAKLDLILKSQPNLLVDPRAISHDHGALLADFCHTFIDRYAERLIERKD